MTQPKKASKFTPGPWLWRDYELVHVGRDKDGNETYHVVLDDGSAGGEYGVVIEPTSPDARLIAAAPEMYELLRRLLTLSSNPEQAGDTTWPCSLGQIIDKARRIKAEIDGEAEHEEE